MPFSVLEQVKVIKGFIPGTFSQLPANKAYSLVFYDCDLYQPALDTFEYFWGRVSHGGIVLVHDYFSSLAGLKA